MKLSELQTGASGIVEKVGGTGSFHKRLIEMGFVPGKKVDVIMNAPLKDPVEYEILGYKVSLRREEAALIEVSSEEEYNRSVTVDAKEGRFEWKGRKILFVDLPGTYSLSAFSPEEKFVRDNLVGNVPDVVINVVDASNLERNLYLTTQVKDMNLRTVMALNMYDELKARGDSIDTRKLGRLLGMPVCPAQDNHGLHIS